MTLSNFDELAFRLLSAFNFFLWPFPLRWDYRNSKIIFKFSAWNIPYCIAIIYIALFGWMCFFLAIYLNCQQRQYFARINAGLIILIGTALTALVIVVCVGFKNRTALLSAFNEFLEFADEIDEEYSLRRIKRAHRKQGVELGVVASLLAVPFFTGAAWVLSFAIVCADFDCPYFIFEEILQDPKERTLDVIYSTIICRFVIVLIICLEAFRTGLFIACCIAIAIDRFTKVLTIMLQGVRNSNEFYVCYTKFVLIFKKAEDFLQIMIYLVMSISFWSLVISCWAVVKCDVLVVGLFIYTTFVLAAIGLGTGHAVLAPLICGAMDLASQVVSIHRLVAEIGYAKRKTHTRKVYLKQCRSIMPVKIKYGPFGTLGKEFCKEYCWVIILRIFDAIMVVEY